MNSFFYFHLQRKKKHNSKQPLLCLAELPTLQDRLSSGRWTGLYLASVVLDAEAVVRQAVVSQELGVPAEAALKVLMFSTNGVQLIEKSLIGDGSWPQTLFIQHGQDATLVLDRGGGGGGRGRGRGQKNREWISNPIAMRPPHI